MKKIISAILILSMMVTFLNIISSASGCNHEYVPTHYSETCVEREKTVYTCVHCGDSYTEYVKGYDEPDGFYLLADSRREGDILTVYVYQYNNPGVCGERVVFSCNTDALSLVSVENGDCFDESVYTGGMNWTKLPFSVAALEMEDHTKNCGLFFKVTLQVIDDSLDYDINITYNEKDIVDWDDSTNYFVCVPLKLVNLVGKNKLAPHTYTDAVIPPTCTSVGKTIHTCTVCGYVSESDTVPMIDHDYVFSRHIVSPDFENEGEDEYICSECFATTTVTVPVLEHWIKGDLNHDGEISPIDSNLMIKLNTGAIIPDVYMYDAADINGDGEVNPIDGNMIIWLILGKI